MTTGPEARDVLVAGRLVRHRDRLLDPGRDQDLAAGHLRRRPVAEDDQRRRGVRPASDLVGPVSQALLAALNLPDQRFHPRGNTACAANYEPPVYLLLIDKAGKAIQPQLPADPCGRPRAEVVQAIQSVQLSKEIKYRFIDAR